MSARTTRPGMPALTRRSLLGAAGGTTAALLLAACGTDTGDRYASGDSGYVSGSGVSTEIPAGDRAEPLEFSGTSYDDEDLSAADLRGEVLVLNVWYASCPPCRKEAPGSSRRSTRSTSSRVSPSFGVRRAGRRRAGAGIRRRRYGITYPSLPDPDAEIMYALRGQVAPNAVPLHPDG